MAEERTVLFAAAPSPTPPPSVVVVLDAVPVGDRAQMKQMAEELELPLIDLIPEALRPQMKIGLDLAEQTLAIRVTSHELLVAMNDRVVALRAIEQEIHDMWDETCDSAFTTWKKATGKRARLLEFVLKAKNYGASDMGRYKREQDAIEEQRRRDAQAEADRLAKIEADRIQADALARAAAVEAAGDQITAEQILETGMVEAQQAIVQATSAVIRQPSTPKLAGSGGFRDHWTFEVDNESLVPREYCSSDAGKIRGFVAPRGKEAIGKIPGVRVYNDSKPVAARRTSG